MTTTDLPSAKTVNELDRVVIRFAGDSGDGMQLAGDRFTDATAAFGNDLATLPDYPAEIRAPAGTIAGVSGFQIHFSDHDIMTPGDAPDVLVAMNPAALKSNLADLPVGGTVIVNEDAFTERNLEKVGFVTNPLDDQSLDAFTVFRLQITTMTMRAVEGMEISKKDAERTKNMFALGLMCWMYGRPVAGTEQWLNTKFAKKPVILEANLKALKAGWNFGETAEIFASSYVVRPQAAAPGTYRNISGNTATAYGLIAASKLSGLPLFLGSYPITPASDILHELSKHKNFGVRTVQAEDEIAAIGAALGAAFGGALGVTTTSGPGVALKGETISLAVSVELPLLIINVQRGGPSTGLPTKTEQSDLLQAIYGRNGESEIPVIACKSPGDSFYAAVEAVKIATRYMCPVMLLSDGYIANGSEPWPVPDIASMQPFPVHHRTDPNGYFVYQRDPSTLARDWVIPGAAGLEHRIGGIEKDFLTGNISYEPINHERQVAVRAEKVARVGRECAPLDLRGETSGDVLVIGWGGTFGSLRQAVDELRGQGQQVSHAHLRWMWPIEPQLEKLLFNFKHVLVAELNSGQLRMMLRGKYLVDAKGLNKVQGQPFKVREVVAAVEQLLTGAPHPEPTTAARADAQA